MKINIKFYLFLLLLVFVPQCRGQVNILGKEGYMLIPSAGWKENRQLAFSFAYLPWEYSVFKPESEKNTVNFYSASVRFASFMEAGISVAYRPRMPENIGVGDRQLDLRFRILKETKTRPALVLGWTPPGSASPVLAHDYLVATKQFKSALGDFEVTAGYASPYVFPRKKNGKNYFDLEVIKKDDLRSGQYLSGFFGGITYKPVRFGGLMLEYDTRNFNAGAFIKPFEWLLLQAYSLEAKAFAFSISTSFRLDFAPNTLRRYENSLE
ncbi:YjbH domain-containing protein [Zunongwangia sp. F363]|uniref:YjbH domain-containing protein n=1 Tax=Autumnicola tepida TaxID=3075595 RepID=A0ABU3C7J4_9FLAO|nr:YjbH domain-containing protein [Zunongwangia sp. F363]MDT0642315.1 YjbH domain-containing protein [Zunongwangia sp. F363]